MALHNRYASAGSLEGPPRVSKGRRDVYHPLDESSRGTWIGFNDEGLFLAVTDQHTGGRQPSYRSRGLLLMDALTSFADAREALGHVKAELDEGGYKRGNFIIADFQRAYHVLNDERVEVEVLKPGLHVVTNLTVKDWMNLENTPPDVAKYANMRKGRAIELASRLKPSALPRLVDELKVMASDHGGGPDRGSICYHGGVEWCMTSSTVMVVSGELKGSRILYCKGNPCENRFSDYSSLVT